MAVNIQPPNGQKPIDFFVPGILAVAVMSTGMVSLSIATAYERYYGVLKRLGSSPLPRWGLLAAKTLSILALEAAQIIFLLALAAILYGWRPQGSFFAALVVLLLGTITFAALGLLMAGALRAEATLAVANGLFLIFLLIGGTILPVERLPGFTQPLARLLPPAAFSDALRGALSPQGVPMGSLLALAVWAVDLPGRGGAHLPLGVAASRAGRRGVTSPAMASNRSVSQRTHAGPARFTPSKPIDLRRGVEGDPRRDGEVVRQRAEGEEERKEREHQAALRQLDPPATEGVERRAQRKQSPRPDTPSAGSRE